MNELLASGGAEADTAATHEDLLQLLYAVPVGLVHAARDGTIELINSAAARWLLPLAPDQRLDNLFTALAGVAPGLRSLVDAAPIERTLVQGDLRLRIDAGPREAPHHVSMTLSRLGAGRLMAVFNDITRQVQDAEALGDGQAHYRAVVAVLSEGILVHDPAGRLLLCNAAAERLLGAPAPVWDEHGSLAPGWTLLGHNGQPLAGPHTPTGRVLRGEAPVPAQLVEAHGPQGQRQWFEIGAQPVISPGSGALLAVVTSFSDVTQRQRLNEQLARHRQHLEDLVAERTRQLEESNDRLEARGQRLRSITDAVPGLISHWGRDLCCRFANSAHLAWYGRHADELLGMPLQELVGAARFELERPHIEAVLRGEAQHFQGTVRKADGHWRHTLTTLVPDVAGDQVTGFNIVVSDVTELKQAELKLQALNAELERRADEADSSTRAKGAFLANMSHEIRTPMNAILGLTQLLTRDAHDPLQRERLGKVDHAARHLLGVINDILDLSKIGAGKMRLQAADFDAESMLEHAFEMVADEAREKGIELVLDTGALPHYLHGDALRLSQALINLLANAVKFTEHGWVRLSTRVEPDAAQGLRVRFEVQDTGPGIEPERQALLFSAFEQADASATRRHGGTGLGLALTRHIAELMGGEAGMHSAPGSGSVFWFSARLAPALAMADEATPSLAGRRALVAVALPVTCEALTAALQRLGMVVDPVSDGAGMLQRLEAAPADSPDVLLVDRTLADGDGIEVLREARRRLGEAVPPAIVLVPGNDALAEASAFFPARIGAWLGKPLAPATLRRVVSAVIDPGTDTPVSPSAPVDSLESRVQQAHAGRRVLVVEDNAINRELAVELLSSVGLVTDTARHGQDALDRLETQVFDLVLMDVQMPVMDGLTAAREIRRRHGHRMPVLAMTANAFEEDRMACLAAGMDDHLAKPIDTERLYGALLRWLPAGSAAVTALAVAPAAMPAAAPLQERLAALGDIDLDRALKHTAGRIAVLERALRRFAAGYADGAPALTTPDPAAWRHVAHSLRGAAETVGAVRLATQVATFEGMLSTATDPSQQAAQAQAIDAELRRLVARLQVCLAA